MKQGQFTEVFLRPSLLLLSGSAYVNQTFPPWPDMAATHRHPLSKILSSSTRHKFLRCLTKLSYTHLLTTPSLTFFIGVSSYLLFPLNHRDVFLLIISEQSEFPVLAFYSGFTYTPSRSGLQNHICHGRREKAQKKKGTIGCLLYVWLHTNEIQMFCRWNAAGEAQRESNWARLLLRKRT